MEDSAVRVLRVIEITYPSLDAYVRDQSSWALPANGLRRYGDKTYSMATMPPVPVQSPERLRKVLRTTASVIRSNPFPGSDVIVREIEEEVEK